MKLSIVTKKSTQEVNLPEDPKEASDLMEVLLEEIQTPELYNYWSFLPEAKRAFRKGIEQNIPTALSCGPVEISLR